jgi:hypothetical protein
MGRIQRWVQALMPMAWARSIEEESRTWVMRCPEGHETSIWDMGGIRYKAAGNPWRFGWCARCGAIFWGRVERTKNGKVEAGTTAQGPDFEGDDGIAT